MSAAGSSEISGASRWLAAFAPSGAARPANRAAIAAAVTSTRPSASPPLRTVMRASLSVAVAPCPVRRPRARFGPRACPGQAASRRATGAQRTGERRVEREGLARPAAGGVRSPAQRSISARWKKRSASRVPSRSERSDHAARLVAAAGAGERPGERVVAEDRRTAARAARARATSVAGRIRWSASKTADSTSVRTPFASRIRSIARTVATCLRAAARFPRSWRSASRATNCGSGTASARAARGGSRAGGSRARPRGVRAAPRHST